MPGATYAFELFSRNGQKIADLGGLATNRKVSAGRNKGGLITFDIDTLQLKKMAESYGTIASVLLGEGKNEIRIKRTDQDGSFYLRQGGRIEYSQDTGSGVNRDTPGVQVKGFLDILTERQLEVQRVFNSEDMAQIMWTVIDEMQTGSANFWSAPLPTADRCDYGITEGILETIADKDRTYEPGKVVRDILVQGTELETSDTDIEITQDKVFNAYERMGTDNPNVVFELGRNILDYKIPKDASALANRVMTVGTGAGETSRVQSIDEDTDSEDEFLIRQHQIQLNSVQEETTLSDHGAGYVSAAKNPLSIPEITVDLNKDINITDFWVGDRVTVRIVDDTLRFPVDGLFKVEQLDLTISDEGSETAKLLLSN